MNQIARYLRFGCRLVLRPRRSIAELRSRLQVGKIDSGRRASYIEWFAGQQLSRSELERQRDHADVLPHHPLVSIIIPTHNTDPQHLRECFESVIAQTYSNWEVCISDDASTREATKAVIREYVTLNPKFHAVFGVVNSHIAISSNNALALASGDFVSLLDHDDLLQPNALYETALVINAHPEADLIYSDEDKLENDTVHVEPFFKPGWSPDFLDSCNYITHFATLSMKILNQVDGFRIGTEGAQDWDLFLRVSAQTDRIHHIPKVLYTWRKSATSTAQSADSKPYAYVNQGKVLRHSVAMRHQGASVETAQFRGFWRIRPTIIGTPLVSIIIPTKDNFELIVQCVDSILEHSSYPYFEIVLVDTGSTDARVEQYYENTISANSQVQIVRWEGEFNFSGACNLGAVESSGEYLLFLNNDTEVITSGWIEGMLEHAQRPDVGMVGVKLLFERGEIQHAGVVLSEEDIAFHPFYGKREMLDIFTYIYVNNVRNTSAVTAACSMVSRSKFDRVGGFDTALRVTYNDVDLCLRLLDDNLFNVYTPHVQLFHYESMSVGKITTSDRDHSEFDAAKSLMKSRWGGRLTDNFYNASFVQRGPGYILPTSIDPIPTRVATL